MTTASGHTSAIRAKKVIGTSVKDTSGEKIGHVEDVVLDKLSNNIMFAVVSFGGFLGIGEKYHAVPWSALDYTEREQSYVMNMTKEQLKAAPADSIDALTKGDGSAERCGGKVRIIASIENPMLIGKILAYLGLGSSATLAAAHAPRAPPTQAPLDLH